MITGKAVIPGKQKPIAPPAPVVQEISFFIDNTEHHADEGMTWADWVNSEYNFIGARIVESRIYKANSDDSVRYSSANSDQYILYSDVIIAGHIYCWMAAGVK